MAYIQAGHADAGQTILMEAGRCHPDIEGTGALGRSMAYIVARVARDQCSNWKSARGSSIQTHYYDRNPDKINILARRVSWFPTLCEQSVYMV